MIKCVNCGKEIGDNSKFCPTCGSKITKVTVSKQENKINDNSINLTWNGIIIIFVAIFLIALFFIFIAYCYNSPYWVDHPIKREYIMWKYL